MTDNNIKAMARYLDELTLNLYQLSPVGFNDEIKSLKYTNEAIFTNKSESCK